MERYLFEENQKIQLDRKKFMQKLKKSRDKRAILPHPIVENYNILKYNQHIDEDKLKLYDSNAVTTSNYQRRMQIYNTFKSNKIIKQKPKEIKNDLPSENLSQIKKGKNRFANLLKNVNIPNVKKCENLFLTIGKDRQSSNRSKSFSIRKVDLKKNKEVFHERNHSQFFENRNLFLKNPRCSLSDNFRQKKFLKKNRSSVKLSGKQERNNVFLKRNFSCNLKLINAQKKNKAKKIKQQSFDYTVKKYADVKRKYRRNCYLSLSGLKKKLV